MQLCNLVMICSYAMLGTLCLHAHTSSRYVDRGALCDYICVGALAQVVCHGLSFGPLTLSLCVRMKCATRRCTQEAASLRARFCPKCFLNRSRQLGGLSSGNRMKGRTKKLNGSRSSGNMMKGRVKSSAGSRSRGNLMKGSTKRNAGKRSGLKRKARDVLVIKKPWLELILARKKIWEIRGSSTNKRCFIHLGLSGSGGCILGGARLVDCYALTRKKLADNVDKHRVTDIRKITYTRSYAWCLEGVKRYAKPLRYKCRPGAISWVRLQS